MKQVEASPDDCQHIYYFRSPAGCGTSVQSGGSGGDTSLSSSMVVFIIILCIISLYCIGGVIYKQQLHGTSGLESIPHVDSIRVATH